MKTQTTLESNLCRNLSSYFFKGVCKHHHASQVLGNKYTQGPKKEKKKKCPHTTSLSAHQEECKHLLTKDTQGYAALGVKYTITKDLNDIEFRNTCPQQQNI